MVCCVWLYAVQCCEGRKSSIRMVTCFTLGASIVALIAQWQSVRLQIQFSSVACILYRTMVLKKLMTVRNPQANAFIEWVHQTAANIIYMFDINNMEIKDNNPQSGIPAPTMFAIYLTAYTMSQYIPSQLVFGRDLILNISHKANWKSIQDHKQRLIYQNNIRENRNRIPYMYNVGPR